MSLPADTERTDADGSFAYDVLPSGTYAVAVAGVPATEDVPALAARVERGLVVTERSTVPTPVEARTPLPRCPAKIRTCSFPAV